MSRHRRPDIVAHADWSVTPAQKRVAVAVRQGSRYRLELVAGGWLATALVLSEMPETLLVGFDFPIGLPAKFADRARISTFPEWLRDIDDRGGQC